MKTAKDLDKAIQWATYWHRGQLDKSGSEPYILHPMRVMIAYRKKFPTHIEGQMAAVLHDVIEDCRVKMLELENKFGLEVATYVVNLSRDKQRQTYAQFIRHIAFNCHDAVPTNIKICDIQDNLTRPPIPGGGNIHKRYFKALKTLQGEPGGY